MLLYLKEGAATTGGDEDGRYLRPVMLMVVRSEEVSFGS